MLDWENDITKKILLELLIQYLERLSKDQKIALQKLKVVRLSNKEKFDKIHYLRFKLIKIEDWMLVFNSSLEHWQITLKKFLWRWFGPYIVVAMNNNATYLFCELDGTILKIHVARKYIKAFKRKDEKFILSNLSDFWKTKSR